MNFYKTLKSLHKITCSNCQSKVSKLDNNINYYMNFYSCPCRNLYIKHFYRIIYTHMIISNGFNFYINDDKVIILIEGDLDNYKYKFSLFKKNSACQEDDIAYTLNQIPDVIKFLKNSNQIIEAAGTYINFI